VPRDDLQHCADKIADEAKRNSLLSSKLVTIGKGNNGTEEGTKLQGTY
jgi:hypothetical protein